jgi:3-phenylpropionate/trans-cinnamate dioxygenase ferredoxin reductase component
VDGQADGPGIVVVGGGLATATLVAELRDRGYGGPITVFTEEGHLPYERPPLSKDLLLGKGGPADPIVHDTDWYADHDVEVRTGTRVTAIDPAGRTVTTGGDQTRYDELVLAVGARPRRLPMADDSGARVTYLRTLDDAVALAEQLRDGARIAIIGAGWIGLEVAAAARENGASVTVIEAAEQPLMRVLGPEVARIFADLHRAHGVDLRLGAEITAIESTGAGGVVQLAAGDPVGFDLLVVGVGVEPVVDVAGAAGLAIDNGIRVDAQLRTSDPHVLAIGDVANADHATLGYPLRVEHWDVAKQHAKVAAAVLTGEDARWEAAPYFFTDQYDLGMEYVGNPGPAGFDRVVVRGDTDATKNLLFAAFWLRDAGDGAEVVAGMHVNDWDAIDDVRRLVGTVVDPDRLADPDVPLGEV